jgi:hypothetical protein
LRTPRTIAAYRARPSENGSRVIFAFDRVARFIVITSGNRRSHVSCQKMAPKSRRFLMHCAARLPKLEIFPPAIRAFAKIPDAKPVAATALASKGVRWT